VVAGRAPGRGLGSATSRFRLATVAALIGLVLHGLFTWAGTSAMFTAKTLNPTNAWATGAVSITDDDGGVAMFNATGLVPGVTGSHCITVSYGGTVTSAVKLYASASAGSLAPYINLTVNEGTGGSYASCTGFTPVGGADYAGTLSYFTAAKTAFGNGVGTWAPTSNGQTRTYQFIYTLDSATPSAMQNAATTATFQWEAQA